MEEGLVKVTPDKAKAESILKMAETSLEMIKTIDEKRFPSNITREYYEVIRELMSAILLLDGYKTYGEGAHKKMIEYLAGNYKQFSSYEISVIDELRNMRNMIAYNGFFVQEDYIKRKKEVIGAILNKLRETLKKRLMK